MLVYKQTNKKIRNKNKVIFTEAVLAASRCARSKSASRADVLQAADETHPPASKRKTTPSFIIIHKTTHTKCGYLMRRETVCYCSCVKSICVRSALPQLHVQERIHHYIHRNLASSFF